MWPSRSIVCPLVIALLVAFLVACTATPTVTPSPATGGAPAESSELHFLWYSDGGEGKVMRALLDDFEAQHPGIRVVLDEVPYAELHDRLQAALNGETPPDLARITDVSRFRGQYLDMRPYLSDPDGWARQWLVGTLSSMRAPNEETGLYGFPSQYTITGPFINRTLFEQAGVPVPSDKRMNVTWDEWEAAARAVAEATETPYALAIDRSGHRFWGPSLSLCAHYLDLGSDDFTLDSPGFRTAAEMLQRWHEEGLMPPDVWGGGTSGYVAASEYFVRGELVFYYSGSWQVGPFAEQIGDRFAWEPVPNPAGPCGSTGVPGGALIVAMQPTTHPAEVTLLIEFLSQRRNLERFSVESLFLPGSMELASEELPYAHSAQAMGVFLDELTNIGTEAFLLQYHPQGFVLNTEIRDRLSQVIAGEITLDEAIQALQQKMDEATQN